MTKNDLNRTRKSKLNLFEKLSQRKKKERVINFLRRKYPGEWIYHFDGYCWERLDDNLIANFVAKLSPKYDGDDDSFTTYLKVGSDENEMIYWRG